MLLEAAGPQPAAGASPPCLTGYDRQRLHVARSSSTPPRAPTHARSSRAASASPQPRPATPPVAARGARGHQPKRERQRHGETPKNGRSACSAALAEALGSRGVCPDSMYTYTYMYMYMYMYV